MITGGTISYGETRKIADYENKNAKVELNFNVAEGADHAQAIENVKSLAKRHCNEMLHGVMQKQTIMSTPADQYCKPAFQIIGEMLDEQEAKAVEKKVHHKRAPKMPEVTTNSPDVTASQGGNASDMIMNFVVPLSETPTITVITDATIMDSVSKTQEKVKNAPAIRKLLNEFVKSPPNRVVDLPQDKRQAFLDGLKLIKPLA